MSRTTDEEKMELVRRCAYLIKTQGRQPLGRDGFTEANQCVRVAHLQIDAYGGTNFDTLVLRTGARIIFSAGSEGLAAVWPNSHLMARALSTIRQYMILDDLTDV